MYRSVKDIIFLKKETTPGVAVSMSGADALFCDSVEFSPDLEYYDAGQVNGGSVPGHKRKGKSKASITAVTPFIGTNADEVKWFRGARAAGFAVTDNTGSFTLKPSANPEDTYTVEYFRDGERHRIVGAVATMKMNLLNKASLEFVFSGGYDTPVDASPYASPEFDSATPLTGLGIGLSYDGHTPILLDFSIDCGCQVAEREDYNKDTGYGPFAITSHSPVASMKVENEPKSTYDWQSKARDDSHSAALSFSLGDTAGNQIGVALADVALGAVSPGTDAGRGILEFSEMTLNDSAAAENDSVVITVS